jgi:hypothetical protein
MLRPEEDINLNSRLFLWPSELEKVLDLSGARLAVVRENLETALKERRAQFEQYLMQEKKKMDSFRLRDVREVLSVEDLKEKVATVDGLMETLEVSEIAQFYTRESTGIKFNLSLLFCLRIFFCLSLSRSQSFVLLVKLHHFIFHSFTELQQRSKSH